ncbi:MAG: sulfatase-like hydrolase/transferase [Bacteroidetes bacterium]|nr:sulfatase-like hydrolase/transferase [Bacteroidota bacterium]
MQFAKNRLLLLGQRMLLLVVLYSFCRFLFLLFNLAYFSEVPTSSLLKDFIAGIRFDLSAIIISNIVFIALHFNPLRFFYSRYYQLSLKIIFLAVNIPLLLFSFIDFCLFRFSAKHATSDAFKIMSFGEDFINTVPGMILDFWYVLVVFILTVFLLVYAYQKIKPAASAAANNTHQPFFIVRNIVFSVVAIAGVVTGFRGGIQYKPISIISASRYGSSKDVALILNTPFTILKTLGKNHLTEMTFFSEEEAEKISPLVHHYNGDEKFRNLNVVVIVMESFGNEYIGGMNHDRGYTPFLDSLMKESLVFPRAFANGKRSIEGIPSIVAGIPSLMAEPFITSSYSENSITSLASLLRKKRYFTSFYHGGTNGTMGFDNFVHLAGFESYYGRREYRNEKDFDGNWGIYDEPFLQNFAKQLNGMKQPFFSVVFTLSSHHPYSIPEDLKNRFRKGTLPIHQSIQYADYSLKKFFEAASQMSFFDSTLFVITADHTALSEYPFYQGKVGMYSVPILYYRHHSSLKGTSQLTTQHIDILPSILDYLHYDEPFFSFGQSVFDSTADHFAMNFLNDTYQMIDGGFSLTLDTVKNNFLCRYVSDSLLHVNLLEKDTLVVQKLERKAKAFIQNYNSSLVENKMTIDKLTGKNIPGKNGIGQDKK